MKNGPPITESMIPTGITIGAKSVRPKVSANNIRNAPKTAEQGINFRKSFPTICRAMWGAARPTNPINPVNAITTDVMSADSTKMFLRIVAGSTPVEIAKSSPPNESALRSHYQISACGSKMITINPINTTFSISGRDRLPKDQCAS